jgi:hypothetical protein
MVALRQSREEGLDQVACFYSFVINADNGAQHTKVSSSVSGSAKTRKLQSLEAKTPPTCIDHLC